MFEEVKFDEIEVRRSGVLVDDECQLRMLVVDWV